MAIKGFTTLTLADWAKRKDPDGKVSTIVELLSQTNPILDDMVFVEANGDLMHTTTVRTGLPAATWRKFNAGVQPSKSTTAQIKSTIGFLEACQSALNFDQQTASNIDQGSALFFP